MGGPSTKQEDQSLPAAKGQGSAPRTSVSAPRPRVSVSAPRPRVRGQPPGPREFTPKVLEASSKGEGGTSSTVGRLPSALALCCSDSPKHPSGDLHALCSRPSPPGPGGSLAAPPPRPNPASHPEMPQPQLRLMG